MCPVSGYQQQKRIVQLSAVKSQNYLELNFQSFVQLEASDDRLSVNVHHHQPISQCPVSGYQQNKPSYAHLLKDHSISNRFVQYFSCIIDRVHQNFLSMHFRRANMDSGGPIRIQKGQYGFRRANTEPYMRFR